jgi:FKBP-type peptidyl-prolyl cis-trans isomerase
MLKIVVLAMVVVASLSLFSEELVEKYSIVVLQEGKEGTVPKKGDRVQMHYEGKLKSGTVFDSSYSRNSPLPVSIGSGQVIKCWDEVGLQMEVGTKVTVLCPSSTAYGSRGVGPIPANSDLIFTIERVE